MATISNSSLVQPVYIQTIGEMATTELVAGRLYYIKNINALWLCLDDGGTPPSEGTNAQAGVYNAGSGVFFGLAKGSALTGTNNTAANLGASRPAGVPIIDTSWLPGTVDEIVEVWISQSVDLDDVGNHDSLFYGSENTITPITPARSTIYLVVGVNTTPPHDYDNSDRINHTFRWSGSQYVDLDNDKFTINELTDVTISSPFNDQVLTYEDGEWVNKTPPTANLLLGLSPQSRGLIYKTGTNTYNTTLGTGNEYLRMDGNGNLEWGTFSVGVTSVGLQMPPGFKVSSTPVTSVGTFDVEINDTVTFANPNTIGVPSVILGAISGSNDAVSTWSFVVAPNSGYVQRGSEYYGADTFVPTEDPGTGATTYHFQTSTATWRVRTGTTGNTWTTVTSGVSSGPDLPGSPNQNDAFYKTSGQVGIYKYVSGTTGVVDGSMYYNTTLNKVRVGKAGSYVSLVDEDDIASLYWIVV